MPADDRLDPDLIRADSGLLNQAFVNLFLNALDSMGENGTLTVNTTMDEPGWHLTRDREQNGTPHVRLAIQDTGEGIPQEMLHRIFDPFFTTKSQGTGLGLSVAHGIIQDHLGLIECASQPGNGTTFNIYFPLAQSEVTT